MAGHTGPILDDPSLPSAQFLSATESHAILAAAVRGAGGTLHQSRPVQVQYRPGSALVMQFRCDITWPSGRKQRDTLLAATHAEGLLPGCIPVVAAGPQPDGPELVTSVWRWPFDPLLPGLAVAATPHTLAELAEPWVGPRARGELVAYRPTERAVFRVSGGNTAPYPKAVYLKVMHPEVVAGVADRHRRLRAAGVAVPEVLGVIADLGVLVLAELTGTTFRQRIKADGPGWAEAGDLQRLFEQFAGADIGPVAPVPSRVADAVAHGRLIGAVAPTLAGTVSRLSAHFVTATDHLAADPGANPGLIHGDLHDGQLMVDDRGSITGVLDIDDVGPGDPLTDAATMLGHLWYRAVVSDRTVATRLRHHIHRLRIALTDWCEPHGGLAALDLVTAAVLVGLATGPYRIQLDNWHTATANVLAVAEGQLTG